MDRFIKTARPIAMAAGPLAVASIIAEFSAGNSPEALASTTGIIAAVLALSAVIALLIGLIALHARQADHIPGPGLTGFILATVGAVMTAGGVWSAVFVVPGLAEVAPHVLETGIPSVMAGFVFSYALLGLGGLLYGIATLRGGLMASGSSILLIVGGVICLAPLPARYFLLAIAISLIAIRLRPATPARTVTVTS
ncbi:hypothetical protein ACO0LV_08195 [Pseudactinotalea sp. Z1739]|uniref:hypothetical protein n=1 Tax=Pseudactinotalea sp. Z1739 TaxID=3413028 RepID=UPI003C7C7E86